MKQHTVKSGETLSLLAYKYGTTIQTIMKDNPIITNKDLIQIGWVLKIRSSAEVAKEKAQQTTAIAQQAKVAATSTATPTKLTNENLEKVYWDGAEVLDGQVGRVRILKPIKLWRRDEKNNLKEIRYLQPNERYRVFNYSSLYGGQYNLGGNQWVTKLEGYVKYEPLPDAIKNQMAHRGKVNTVKTAGTTTETITPTIPQYDFPDYHRPVLQVKYDNNLVTMELRVIGVTSSMSNIIQQNRTNGGWLINLGGSNLTVLNINGLLLDTKANQEFDEFLDRYKKYMLAYRNNDYYASAVSTFYYKGTEYRGLIAAFNWSDQVQESLHRKFSFQFVVLKEKNALVSGGKIPFVIDKKGKSTEEFYGDIQVLLTSPITGVYATDAK